MSNYQRITFWMTVAASVLAVVVASCAPSPVYAEETERNPAIIKQFKETHECPSTNRIAVKGVASSYVCPGYVVDHGIPFCAGKYIGLDLDKSHNLFYQKHDKENSLRKDADERKLCATLKRASKE